MYSNLVNFLQSNNYYIVTTVAKLKPNCCDSNVPVLDFIAIKTLFQQQSQAPAAKSVDGLLFSKGNKLFFLRIEAFASSYSNFTPTGIANTLIEGNYEKIDGTIFTLSEMLKYYSISSDFITFCTNPAKEKVRTIILSNIDSRNYVKMKLGNNEVLNIKKDDSFFGKITIMDCGDFERHFA